MVQILIVGMGGFVGAILRYGLSGWIHRFTNSGFPYGTLAVNIIGCLLIGVLMGLVEYRPILSPGLRLFLTIGLLGSLTTFSTFGYETFELLRQKEFLHALANMALNGIVGLAAVAAGWTLAKTWAV